MNQYSYYTYGRLWYSSIKYIYILYKYREGYSIVSTVEYIIQGNYKYQESLAAILTGNHTSCHSMNDSTLESPRQ